MTPSSIKCRPSFAHWGPTVVVNAGIVIALYLYRSTLGISITDALRREEIRTDSLQGFPFWLALSGIPALIAIRTLVWALTTEYDINLQTIRIVHGGLLRKEQFIDLDEVETIAFQQNLLEALFGVGRVVIVPHNGARFSLAGVPTVRALVDGLRDRIRILSPGPTPYSGGGQVNSQNEPVPQAHARVIIHEKRSGCMGCLVILLIIIVLPTAVGIIFNAALVTSLIASVIVALGKLFH